MARRLNRVRFHFSLPLFSVSWLRSRSVCVTPDSPVLCIPYCGIPGRRHSLGMCICCNYWSLTQTVSLRRPLVRQEPARYGLHSNPTSSPARVALNSILDITPLQRDRASRRPAVFTQQRVREEMGLTAASVGWHNIPLQARAEYARFPKLIYLSLARSAWLAAILRDRRSIRLSPTYTPSWRIFSSTDFLIST
ncbi:hypothetical protein GY45DRAFT_654691 [Cubamyces sp. BRFM 1775]|nr:hypothetical protein GY45DRAFT_654691 [Cubamyces sp. BRFM 1775]